MSTGILNSKWARDAVKAVTRAVDEYNDDNPKRPPIRIVVGYANKEAEQEERRAPRGHRQQHALISYDDFDFDLWISSPGVSGFPSMCRIGIFFGDIRSFPSEPRETYNLMQCLAPAVQLMLLPDEKKQFIEVLGVETHVSVDCISGKTVIDAIQRIAWSFDSVGACLFEGECRDNWGRN